YLRDAGGEAERPWTQNYLSRISYVDYKPASSDVTFLSPIDFSSDERPDPFSDCRAGFDIRTRKRCSRIEISSHADGDQLVRRYRLVYLDQPAAPPEELPLNRISLLSQIIVEASDEQPALPLLRFGYTKFEPR